MKMKKETTLKDIAQVLNVTPATVSRALHDDYQISEATKQRVMEMAKKMDYSPNPLALGLLSKKTKVIGVIVPDIFYYFNSAAISGIEEVLNRAGYSVIVCQSKEKTEKEKLHLKNLIASRTDGAIISIAQDGRDFSHYEKNIEKGFPLVFLDRVPAIKNISSVTIDNKEAARKATAHLIKQGCKKIAYVAGPSCLVGLNLGKLRYEGYIKAHVEAGLEINRYLLVNCNFDKSLGRNAVKKLLESEHKPDGILAINDRLAIGAMAAVRDVGLRIPEDVKVMGFNNETFDEFLHPALSTVYQPANEMGQEAAKILLTMLESKKDNFKAVSKTLPTRVVKRASTI
jgi:DNA-binding LacI/PurR family transcriptional regulator